MLLYLGYRLSAFDEDILYSIWIDFTSLFTSPNSHQYPSNGPFSVQTSDATYSRSHSHLAKSFECGRRTRQCQEHINALDTKLAIRRSWTSLKSSLMWMRESPLEFLPSWGGYTTRSWQWIDESSSKYRLTQYKVVFSLFCLGRSPRLCSR